MELIDLIEIPEDNTDVTELAEGIAGAIRDINGESEDTDDGSGEA